MFKDGEGWAHVCSAKYTALPYASPNASAAHYLRSSYGSIGQVAVPTLLGSLSDCAFRVTAERPALP